MQCESSALGNWYSCNVALAPRAFLGGTSLPFYKWQLTVRHFEPNHRTKYSSVIMGNVMAASVTPPPPPPSPGPGLMPNLPGKQDPSADAYPLAEAPTQIENPGTMEDLHKKYKGTYIPSPKRLSRGSLCNARSPLPSLFPSFSLGNATQLHLAFLSFYHRKFVSRP